jgi:hypothetical protein
MTTQSPLPTHIGGYQHLEPDVITRSGDIYVEDGKPVGFVVENLGVPVGEVEESMRQRVYRKMPCPKQGGERVESTPDQPKAATYDDGKPPLACLPLKGLREVAMVQLYGQQKYGDFYNYKKGMELSRNASCAMRHIADYMDGQDLDTESKRSHLAHAACRLLFMLENLADGTAIDDRYKQSQ